MLMVGVAGQQKGVLPSKPGDGLALVVMAALKPLPLACSALATPMRWGVPRSVGSSWVTKRRQRSAPLKLMLLLVNHEQKESTDLLAWSNLNLTEGSTVLLMTTVVFQQANTGTLTSGCCP